MHEIQFTEGAAEELIRKVKEDEKQAEKHYKEKKDKGDVRKTDKGYTMGIKRKSV
jgi:hypothetical protein